MMVQIKEVYQPEVEQKMRNVYDSFSEKDRRRYAAAEALKLGYGGVAYIARLFGCSRDSVEHGMRELDRLPDDLVVGRGKGRSRGG